MNRRTVLLLSSIFPVMASAGIAAALPTIELAFPNLGSPMFWIPALLSVTPLCNAIGSPIFGWLVDRMGRKWILLLSLVGIGISGSAGSFLGSFPLLFGSRAVLGFAVAGVMTSVTALIADYYKGQERAQMMGYQAAAMGLSGGLSLLIGGALSDLSWRAPFLIYLSAIPLIPLVFYVIDEPDRDNATETFRNEESGVIPWVIFGIICMMTFVAMSLFFLLPTVLPFYLKNMLGISGFKIGFALSFCNVFGTLASLVYVRIQRFLKTGVIASLVFASVATGFSVFMVADSYFLIIVGIAFIGIGVGLLLPNSMFWVTSILPEKMIGRGVGAVGMSFFLGPALSPLISYPLVQANGHTGWWGLFHMAALLCAFLAVFFMGLSIRQKKVVG